MPNEPSDRFDTVRDTRPTVRAHAVPRLNDDAFDSEGTERHDIVPVSDSKLARGTLKLLTGVHAGRTYSIDPELVIGRGSDVHVPIDDPGVSRLHARIFQGPDGFFRIEDLGSTNGTYVAGTRVLASLLEPGNRIQLGPNAVLRFVLTDDEEDALVQRLYEASTRDPLTRAFNRTYMMERLMAECAHLRRHGGELAVLMLDIDHFKQINDVHGHLVGDVVLQTFAAHIRRVLRQEDLFGRFGGEEFFIIARGAERERAESLGEKIRRTVEGLAIEKDGTTISVTVSVGVATLGDLKPSDSRDLGPTSLPDDLMVVADRRLYAAKLGGRNRVCANNS